MVQYKLKNPIRNNILNYKQTVLSIESTDPDYLDNLPCECASSEFSNVDHGHIITGDLRLIENSQLRSLLSKGPNYREPANVTYKKCLEEIDTAIQDVINETALLRANMYSSLKKTIQKYMM